jgi:hypothetical protein
LNLTNIDKLNIIIEQGMFEPISVNQNSDENERSDYKIIYLMTQLKVSLYLKMRNVQVNISKSLRDLRILSWKREMMGMCL